MFDHLFSTIKDVNDDVKLCNRCVFGNNTTKRVPGFSTNKTPEYPVMIVSDYPGETEEYTGIPFKGTTGMFFRQALAEILFQSIRMYSDPDDLFNIFYFTNILKCVPRRFVIDKVKTDKPRPTELKICTTAFLTREIQIIMPKLILAAGQFAVSTLCKIDKKIDSRRLYQCVLGSHTKVVTTINPASIFYHLKNPSGIGQKMIEKFQGDLKFFVQNLLDFNILSKKDSGEFDAPF